MLIRVCYLADNETFLNLNMSLYIKKYSIKIKRSACVPTYIRPWNRNKIPLLQSLSAVEDLISSLRWPTPEFWQLSSAHTFILCMGLPTSVALYESRDSGGHE